MSAAARRLHLSQSALSQTIQALERELGVQLLVRSSTGVTTTEAGQMLLREGQALLAQHDRIVAAVTGLAAPGPGTLRVGVPLELPADLLPRVLAGLGDACPQSRVELRHASSSAQLAALRAEELDIALVRERPPEPDLDAVLAVEEALGVLLAEARARDLAREEGVRLAQLAGLDWVGFPRAESPAWYDEVTAILRSHGVTVPRRPPEADASLIAEVKFGAVRTGHAFALAPPGWTRPLPGGLSWHPLIGRPIVRRTWAVWPAEARRRDLAVLVAALDLTAPRL